MKLNGGVIIIGSLIWEDHLNSDESDNIRKDWRMQNLLGKRTLTKVPIRYGRLSQTKNNTYTMVFSKSCENNLGQALILSFNEDVVTFEVLERQALGLAIADGIYKKDNSRLTSSWGSVALLIDPKLKQRDFASYEHIKRKWRDIYHSYSDIFVADNYRTKEESELAITQDGFLNINWQQEMNGFDLLIATPVIPKPNSFVTPREIARRIIEQHNDTYFQNNRKCDIRTSADETIQQVIENSKSSK